MTSDPRSTVRVDDEFVPADDAAVGRAFKWSVVAILGGAVLAAVTWWSVRPPPPARSAPAGPLAAPVAPPKPLADSIPSIPFTDVTAASGIAFVYSNGASGEKLLPETMSGGVAAFDYDNDGRQDLFFVNGTAWPWDAANGVAATRCALYRNEGVSAGVGVDAASAALGPVPRFRDVTDEAGLGVSLHGMGVATGDYDGDGLVDLFVTAVGQCRLFRNLGGSFSDVTADAGVGGAASDWHTGAAFADFDRDGDLDLWVLRYVKWSREIDFEVDYKLTGVGRAYGPPTNFEGTDSILWRNDGDGRFTDVSAEAGVLVRNPATGQPVGKGLAVALADLDGNGWLDVVVANDKTQNFAFRNLGGESGAESGVGGASLRFEEIGVASGLAFDRNGSATGAMGIDSGEFLDNGLLAIAIGNFANEMTSFYVSRGAPPDRMPFSDDAVNEGIGAPTRLVLSFGVLFMDADLDGRLDLLQANGHIEDQITVTQPSQRYAQSAQLFWNRGASEGGPRRGCYVELPKDRLGALPTPIVGRAVASADFDQDGDLDVVITQPKGAPMVLRNDQASGHHWLRVVARGRGKDRDAVGAVVEVVAGGRTQRRVVMPTKGYLSQSELPVTIGLGEATSVESLRVTWPDGETTTHAVDGVDRVVDVSHRAASASERADSQRPPPR